MSFFKTGTPFLIAGPCSAESQEQVADTMQALASVPVQLFRAGVWKPRTRPGSFEGNGEKALVWLKNAKEQFKLPFSIEVAEPEHIDLALKYNTDVLWIGARTTVNPFQVQRLADALTGVNIPVMVKNPVNPDIDLWMGAIERFEKAGITDIAAIHRGFSGYGPSTGYRNQPNWAIPIELKRRMPELPIICDPSHITGNRNRIGEVAQKALDMHFDGLMVEVHPSPDDALSDAKQQIIPATYKQLVDNLVLRTESTDDMSGQVRLEHLRQQMDAIDAEIIDLIAKRMELSELIGDVKKNCNMTTYQPARWREIVATTTLRAHQHNLAPQFIVELYERIHDESIRRQLEILENAEKQIKK